MRLCDEFHCRVVPSTMVENQWIVLAPDGSRLCAGTYSGCLATCKQYNHVIRVAFQQLANQLRYS